jgi:2-oxoglutarate dehydrogenase E1 component
VERFLGLAADENMQICMPSTPASYFHLLQEQALMDKITPLIVFTPKSLLRHKMAVSSLDQLCQDSSFMPVIGDDRALEKVKKVVLCSGKVYYDLLEQAIANNLTQVAIVRLEQLYPFPAAKLRSVLAKYSQAQEFVWCQEEPGNRGALGFISEHWAALIKQINSAANFAKVARAASSTPATGYLPLHTQQQTLLIKQALAI